MLFCHSDRTEIARVTSYFSHKSRSRRRDAPAGRRRVDPAEIIDIVLRFSLRRKRLSNYRDTQVYIMSTGTSRDLYIYREPGITYRKYVNRKAARGYPRKREKDIEREEGKRWEGILDRLFSQGGQEGEDGGWSNGSIFSIMNGFHGGSVERER